MTTVRLDGEIPFEYSFPRSISNQALVGRRKNKVTMEDLQFDLIEHHWHLPTLFSLFGPQTFYKLLTAVLLERSIVFVHEQHNVVSSILMALKTILRPFMWCHSFIPVLPRETIDDYVLQPLPVLVGITTSDYEHIIKTTCETERRYKTWIFLDCHLA